jgi:hypothetical protein
VTLRWESPFRAVGHQAVSELWASRPTSRVLLVAGAGFDPRAPTAYECIAAAYPGPVDVLRIALPSPGSQGADALAMTGQERIAAAAAAGGGTVMAHDVLTEDGHARALLISRKFFDAGYIDNYDEMIVDVSALPRGVFFPLIKGMIELHDLGRWEGQLHVVACDNPEVDALVTGDGIAAPQALAGFGSRSASDTATRIWVPILGENEVARVEALYLDIRPAEICPALPFPAADPRRADELVLEYRPFLIDAVDVELRNFIYAAESDPFDLYRTLSVLNSAYAEALAIMGETRMILSAHSSKLLSVGALLAAFEQGLEVRHAGPTNYAALDLNMLSSLAAHDLVVDLWLTGEPYA